MIDPFWTPERGYSHAAALLARLEAERNQHATTGEQTTSHTGTDERDEQETT